jgi:heme/copper-type cytochrome/quinol oxidase subunit 2
LYKNKTSLELIRLTEHTKLEIIWTILPSLFIVYLLIPSFFLLFSIDAIVDDPIINVKVTGHQ